MPSGKKFPKLLSRLSWSKVLWVNHRQFPTSIRMKFPSTIPEQSHVHSISFSSMPMIPLNRSDSFCLV
jgi:hypothetical protein